MIVLTTDVNAIEVSTDQASAVCPRRTTCDYSVASASVVTISDGNVRIRIDYDTFSAPPSCVGVRNTCTFTLSSNLDIVVTTRAQGIGPQ